MPTRLEPHLAAARLVNEAGGELVGRTRLQKVASLARQAGLLDAFDFEYRHYGPFSQALETSMSIAAGLGIVEEVETRTQWGGWYSTYRATERTPGAIDQQRIQFVSKAKEISAIQLELAATAAFLHAELGLTGPEAWIETARRKPDKAAEGRLDMAKDAYRRLRELPRRHPFRISDRINDPLAPPPVDVLTGDNPA